MDNHYVLFSAAKTKSQLAAVRRKALAAAKKFGRIRVDGESCMVTGWGVVVSCHPDADRHYLIIEFDTEDEAVAFVAEYNGETVDQVWEQTGERVRMEREYLHNLRTGKKAVQSRQKTSTSRATTRRGNRPTQR